MKNKLKGQLMIIAALLIFFSFMTYNIGIIQALAVVFFLMCITALGLLIYYGIIIMDKPDKPN